METVVALTTALSHFSGCIRQLRHASEVPPTTTALTVRDLVFLWGGGTTCCCCVLSDVCRAEKELRGFSADRSLSVCLFAADRERSGKWCSVSDFSLNKTT